MRDGKRSDFRSLRVVEVRRETPEAVSIRFAIPPALEEEYRFLPGQYLTLRATLRGEEVLRTYSLCSSPEDGELRVAVKKLTGGAFSTFVNETLRAGETLDVLPAAGHFTVPFSPERRARYAAFACGSGITPILSLLKSALAIEPHSQFSLFYGNRTSEGIVFLEELAALKNRHLDRLEVFHFLTMEDSDVELFNGRLDGPKVTRILGSLLDPAAVERFFVCGPEAMMTSVEDALRAAGVPPERVLLERFTSAGARTPLSDDATAQVRAAAGRRMGVTLEGRKLTVLFDAERGNILDSVRQAGLPAPFACKGGVCATCRARVVSGTVEMRLNYGLTRKEVAQGYVLTCQATPTSDDVALTYDG